MVEAILMLVLVLDFSTKGQLGKSVNDVIYVWVCGDLSWPPCVGLLAWCTDRRNWKFYYGSV